MSEFVQNDGKSFSLKDQLINENKIDFLNELLFDSNPKFKNLVMSKVLDLELKERISYITICMHEFLPNNYEEAIKFLVSKLPQKEPNTEAWDFIYAPLMEYVQVYGLKKEYLEISFNAFEKFSLFISAEFSIRDFLNEFPEETMEFLEMMNVHSDLNCRRLASEGLRPKLPWAKKINLDYKLGVRFLDDLYKDSSRLVTRSVANHMNDLSKINPNLTINTLQNWKNENVQDEKELDYIIKHSLRTLIKQGNKEALEFLGFNSNPNILIKNLQVQSSKVKLNSYLEFSFDIFSWENQQLIIDYILHYPNPKSKPKTFKLKTLEMDKNENIFFEKKHKLKAMSTKKLYFGTHKIELQINGNSFGSFEFELVNE